MIVLERVNRTLGVVLEIAAKTVALVVIVRLAAGDVAERLELFRREVAELPSAADVVERLRAG